MPSRKIANLIHGVIISLLVSLTPMTFANQSHSLTTINHNISSLKSHLKHDQKVQKLNLSKLKNIEITTAKLLSRINHTQNQLTKQQQTLLGLKKKLLDSQQHFQQQRDQLAAQLRTAYYLGRQPYLKLLLNTQNTTNIHRLITYYQLLSQQQLITLHQLSRTMKAIQTTQQQVLLRKHQLQLLQANLKNQRKKLKLAATQRRIIISKISLSIRNKQQRLAILLTNKRHLLVTLKSLKTNNYILSQQDFAHLQGHLPWPTQGKIEDFFDNTIYHSQLRWAGILIATASNEPVKAIANGKVVFADWLAGYGLLIIIDHGHGYMSLYGRNHNLYKKVGDYVRQGDIIASVGNTGGYKKIALYFAIRHNAKPLDPSKWCSKSA